MNVYAYVAVDVCVYVYRNRCMRLEEASYCHMSLWLMCMLHGYLESKGKSRRLTFRSTSESRSSQKINQPRAVRSVVSPLVPAEGLRWATGSVLKVLSSCGFMLWDGIPVRRLGSFFKLSSCGVYVAWVLRMRSRFVLVSVKAPTALFPARGHSPLEAPCRRGALPRDRRGLSGRHLELLVIL